MNIISVNWATPTSPAFPTLTIVVGALGFQKLEPVALMAEAYASPTMIEPAGTKIVPVTMYVPAGK